MNRAWYEWRDAPKADFAVIGDPVSHSLSPQMHTAAYEALGLKRKYVAVRVPESEFEAAVRHLQDLAYFGLNVTVPLKEEAFRWSEGGDPRIGAVNTLRLEDRQAIGTDAPGFLKTLTDLEIGRCRVLVLGAGGSARSVCVALSDAGYEVHVHNRTVERAVTLINESRSPITLASTPDPSGCGLIVNATSAGIHGISPSVIWENANKDTVAYDLLYARDRTPFLSIANQFGMKTIDGKRLLVAQGALSFEWWTGLTAPLTAMIQAVS